jgi:tRNA A-37 threonylcarbamoyl transferase component Bud32
MDSSPRVGTSFAGYRIEAVIGQGGMSTVYRAEHPRLGSVVAVKVLDPRLGRDEAFRERFVREARMAAALNHPNVIPVYDAGHAGDELFIVMRHVAGRDLGALLREQGRLENDVAARLLAQACNGLDSAHQHGLVHGDVKPANLLLEKAGDGAGGLHLYVADFGVVANIAETGGSTGTFGYMAPEQIEGKPIDPRTDVYALGCVAYECLCGMAPFSRDGEAATLWAHMQEVPTPPTHIRPELPSGLDQVLARAMAKSPEDRYASCTAFSHDIGIAASGGAPARPRRPPKPHAERRPRSRLWDALGCVVAVAVGAGLAFVATRDRGDSSATVTSGGTVTVTAPTYTGGTAALRRIVSGAAVLPTGCDAASTRQVHPDDVTVWCRLGSTSAAAGQVASAISITDFPPDWTDLYDQYKRNLALYRAVDPLLRTRKSDVCGGEAANWHHEAAWRRSGGEKGITLGTGMHHGMRQWRADGRVVCWTSRAGEPEIEWTLNNKHAYLLIKVEGTLAKNDQRRLYALWAKYRNSLVAASHDKAAF